MTSLALLTIPLGDAGQFALSGLSSCGLSAPFGIRSVNPLRGKTTDWKAGCGKSACPVWREGGRTTASPYPYPNFGLYARHEKCESEWG
jgi:hypothetical protein